MKKHLTKIMLAFSLMSLQTDVFAALPAGFEVETVASGFSLPTTITSTPDGRMLVAEKGGVVRVVRNGVLLPTPLIALSDVNNYGDRGLLGMAVDPNFASNGYLYLLYTYENTPGANLAGPKNGRIVRVTVVGDTADESTKVVLVGKTVGTLSAPSCENYARTEDCIPSDTSSHSVGGLRFGPDGKLYASFGDGAHFDYIDARALRSQDIDSLGGKIIRINTDGTAPSDNPFYNGSSTANRSKVYAYGFRNSFRFNFHPTTGILYASDVGWSTWEEVNKVLPGSNYGWPCREGNNATTYACTASPRVDPLYTYGHDVNGAGSVTGGAFGTAYPSTYTNTMFFGDYAQNWIKMMTITATGTLVSVTPFMDSVDGPDGPVEFIRGLDGNVYFLSIYTGELRRILYTTGNRQPVAQISATPTSGLLPLVVSFSGASSTDPDGDVLTYLWNFGDGSTSTSKTLSHTYTTARTYNASLTVSDGKGGQGIKSVPITAGNRRPTATITSPVNSSLYRINDIIQASAVANDPEDGALPVGAYHWTILLHHNTHTHTLQTATGPSVSFIAPDHAGALDVYTEVILTVNDSNGLTDTRSVNIYLNNNPATTGNLVLNPSFEDAAPGATNSPDHWQKAGYGTNGATYTYPILGFDGEKAARVSVSSYVDGDAKWGFEPVSIEPNTRYRFSGYYVSNIPTGLTLQVGNASSTFNYYDLGDVSPAAGWTKVEKVFTTPANARAITIFQTVAQIGTLDIDNISLTLEAVATSTPDTTAPFVSLTSPTSGTTVSGPVAINATSSDNIGVVGVKFYLDNNQVGVEDTTSPYTASWNTASSTNGSHTLVAVARDAANNVATSSVVTVTVSNATTTPPVGTNLIVNPSVEIVSTTTPSRPFAWSTGSWGTNTTTFAHTNSGYDGSRAIQISTTAYTSGDAKWVPADVAVTPGKTYTFTHAYQSGVTTSLLLRYTSTANVASYVTLQATVPISTVWKTDSFTFTVPAGMKSVTPWHVLGKVGTLSTDLYSITDPSAIPTETTKPTVAITFPTNGSTVSGPVAINATSSDNIGVVGVKFYLDNNQVGVEDTTSPYTASWNTASSTNGSHTLAAVARDADNNVATSSVVTVTVSNGVVTPTNLIVNGSLETLGTGGNPASFNRGGWGNNTLLYTYPIVGQDGNKAASVKITNYVDGDAKWYPNDVNLVYGTLYSFSDYYRSDTISDVIGRYTMTDGTYLYFGVKKENPPTANWNLITATFTPPITAKSVTFLHLISANGTVDIDGMSLTAIGNASSTNDITPPVAQILSPLSGQTVSGNVTLTASSSDNMGVTNIWFAVDGVQVSPFITTLPYTYVWNSATYPNGAHVLKVTTNDASGNNSTATTTIIVNNTVGGGDTTKPTVAITFPTNGSTVSGPVAINATSSDNIGVVGVKFYLDNNQVGVEDTTSPYTASWNTASSTNGSHTLVAVARDAANNVATSTAVVVTVGNGTTTPPVSGNLITNPSVETASTTDPTKPLSWNNSKWGTNTTTFTYPVAGYLDAKAVQISTTAYTSGDAKWFPLNIAVTPGKTYTFSHAYKSTATSSLDVRYTSTTGVNSYVSLAPTLPASAAWKTDSYTFTVPAGINSMTVMHILEGVGTVTVDNYSLSTVDNIPPFVAIVSPLASSTTTKSGVNLLATSTDNLFVEGVTFYVDGVQVGSESLTPDLQNPALLGQYFGYWDNSTSTTGAHTITAVARDSSGNRSTSTPVVINVRNNGVITILSPGASSPVSGSITIAANVADTVPTQKVQFNVSHLESSVFTTDDLSAPYSTTWDTRTVADGVYDLSVAVVDAFGGTYGTSTTVTVNNATTTATTTPPVNLISNASLQATGPDDMPLDWFKGGWGTNDATYLYTASSSEGATSVNVAMTSYTDGDAKWFFKDVFVTPLASYTYSEFYTSSVPTTLTVRYTMTNGTFVYVDLPNVAPATPTWTDYVATIIPPAGAVSMTIFHKLSAVGTLGVDSISLTKDGVPVDPGLFSQGMVSLTLDDGWLSHYTTALPMLNSAGLKATFGIVSQETAQAVPDNRISNASLEVVEASTTKPLDWSYGSYGTNDATSTFPVAGQDGLNAAKVQITSYTDGDAKWYFKDGTVIPNQDYNYTSYYISDATTTLTVRYTYTDNSIAMLDIGTVGPAATWTQFSTVLHIPANVYSLTVFHRLLSVGSLTIDNTELKRVQVYVDPTQMLALQSAGHEISSHTQTHASLSSVATSSMIAEIANSKSDLEGMGATVSTIIYPYGDYNDAVIQQSKVTGYAGARSVDRGYNTKSTDKYALKIQQIDASSTPAQINTWIDQALLDKTWLVLMYHQIDGSNLPLSESPADFQQTINYLLSKNAWVVTMKQGLSLMNP